MAISKGNLWSFSPKDEFPYSYQIVLMPIALFIDVIEFRRNERSKIISTTAIKHVK